MRVRALALVALVGAALLPHTPATSGFMALPPKGLIAPLYSYPGPEWNELVSLKNDNPGVPVVAIINPSNGPGWSANADFQSGVQALAAAGVMVVGYVHTSWGSRPLGQVESEVSEYKAWYGLGGVFLDEMANAPGYEGYYAAAKAYASSIGIQTVIGNPGAPLPSSYDGVLDMYVVAEGYSVAPGAGAATPSSLSAAIILGATSLDQGTIDALFSELGFLYITDQAGNNPYSVLPTYLASEMQMMSNSVSGTFSTDPTITIITASQTGAPLPGMSVNVTCGGQLVARGQTPFNFSAVAGQTYTVEVSPTESYAVAGWSNGQKTSVLILTPAYNQVVTAYLSKARAPVASSSPGGSNRAPLLT